MYTLKKIGLGLMFLGGLAALIAVIMLLWNWLFPALFNLPLITYWQAGGLFILCKILFGRFGHGHHHRRFSRNHHHLHEKVKGMSKNERREFIRKHMEGFGRHNEEQITESL